ncbi:MAG: nickel-dependent lactate racemase [Syntrophorhabdaceae bacterium]|nr:nickel-dependent lactate racemase [Syntrophorhabdaceae bacterium]
MEYALKYGERSIRVDLPSSWKVSTLTHRDPPALPVYETLLNSLENPIQEERFSEWVRPFKEILIVVPDVTRYAAMERILPILKDQYLKDHTVKIIFAMGNHRKHTEEEQRNIVSERIFKEIPCVDHDCFDEKVLAPFGKTRSGLDVVLNKMLLEADAAIVTGSINFHYLAGFGGGRKSIFPGIAGYETIIGIHREVFNKEKPGKHEKARSGVLHGNPMHEEIMEGISLIKTPMFLINTVLDDKKNIVNIFSGHIRYAHEEGCEWYKRYFQVKVDERADVVVVSVGGFPKDINFIQSHKAIEHAMGAIKDGGSMVVVGECKDGLGSGEFLKWFDYGSSFEMEPHVRKSDKVYSQTAYATRLKAERCRIYFVSELEDETVKKMGLIPKKDVMDAIYEVDDGSEKLCYIIPNGSSTLTFCD